MEEIISNPGLQHLAEKVFCNLDVEDLRICEQINQSCKQILKNPMFWLRKFRYLSQESQKDWIKIIQSMTSSDCEKIIIPYMQRSLKMGFGIDSTLFGKPNQRYRVNGISRGPLLKSFQLRVNRNCVNGGDSVHLI